MPRAVPIYLRASRQALDLAGGQAEHLAQLADRAAGAVGGKRRHQCRVVTPVALVHARYQHLAQLAREVEVDVRQPAQVLVQEAPQRQPARDRVDVRQPDQVADQRGDRRSPPAPGRMDRQNMSWFQT